jgi:hypothetical protein
MDAGKSQLEPSHLRRLADFGLAAEFPERKGPLAATPGWMGGSAGSQALGSADSFLASRDVASSFVGTAEYLVGLHAGVTFSTLN